MAYDTNRFCWHGVISTDVAKAKAFYPEALGWSVQTMQMGDEEAAMLAAGDVPLAHLSAPQAPGMPSHWENYLRVDDVDATVAAAEKAGGKVLAPPMDIPPGRMAVIASPSGAALSLFHEADESTATHHPGGEGGVHWTELHSHKIDEDVAFLRTVFGFETEAVEMPGTTYHILSHGGFQRGGAMPSQSPDAPSAWLSWVHVADVDATLARVKNNGGNALSEVMDMEGIGRMVVVTDNTGGAFGIITPAAES